METLDEVAELKARVRVLEAELRAERANVERERRSNGTLALELHESRERVAELRSSYEALGDKWTTDTLSACKAARAWKVLAKNQRHVIALQRLSGSSDEAMQRLRVDCSLLGLRNKLDDSERERRRLSDELAGAEAKMARVDALGAEVRAVARRRQARRVR